MYCYATKIHLDLKEVIVSVILLHQSLARSKMWPFSSSLNLRNNKGLVAFCGRDERNVRCIEIHYSFIVLALFCTY